jgi:hypothetical protein
MKLLHINNFAAMKSLVVIIIIFFQFSISGLFGQCNEELVKDCTAKLENATYLKDFRVRLKKAEKNKPMPVARYTVYLNKGTHYRFSVCNSPDYAG